MQKRTRKYQASQILVAGLSPALSDPAPKLSNSKVVGISLDANIAKVGAHSSWHSSKPLKTFASIQVSKASTLSEAVNGNMYFFNKPKLRRNKQVVH